MNSLLSLLIVIVLIVTINGFKGILLKKASLSSYQLNSITSNEKYRVLLLVEPTPFNYVSGYANRFKEMLKHMKSMGQEVEILTPDKDPNPPTEFNGYPITTVRGYEFPLYNQITLSFDFQKETPRLIQKLKPDLIHVATPSALVWPAVFWCWVYKIPLVMSYHTNFPEYAKAYVPVDGIEKLANFLLRTFHRHADLTLCTSPQLADDMNAAGIERIDVWQKGINGERFSPSFKNQAMRERLTDGNPNSPLLLYVGRLGAEKKVTRLRKVLDENPGARLAIIGRGPAAEEIKEYFKDYPVHFAGEVTGDPLSQAFASADIFVMPSDSETLGFVVLEAMASGLPVVGVAAGGLVDIIEDEKTGYLVQNGEDMVEFSSRTKQLIESLDLRKKLGEHARKWTEDWTWEAATMKLLDEQYKKAILNFRERKIIEKEEEKRQHEEALLQRGNFYRPDLA